MTELKIAYLCVAERDFIRFLQGVHKDDKQKFKCITSHNDVQRMTFSSMIRSSNFTETSEKARRLEALVELRTLGRKG